MQQQQHQSIRVHVFGLLVLKVGSYVGSKPYRARDGDIVIEWGVPVTGLAFHCKRRAHARCVMEVLWLAWLSRACLARDCASTCCTTSQS
jgi:hypothetical protein